MSWAMDPLDGEPVHIRDRTRRIRRAPRWGVLVHPPAGPPHGPPHGLHRRRPGGGRLARRPRAHRGRPRRGGPVTCHRTLTAEHHQVIADIRDRLMAAGLSTKRADRAAAEAAVRDGTARLVIAEPRIVIWMDSPSAGCLQPRRSASSGASSGTSSGTSLGPALGPAQGPARGPARGPAPGPALGPAPGPALGDQLWDQLWGQLWDQLGDQLGDQLWGQLWDQPRGPALGPAPGPASGPALGPALGPTGTTEDNSRTSSWGPAQPAPGPAQGGPTLGPAQRPAQGQLRGPAQVSLDPWFGRTGCRVLHGRPGHRRRTTRAAPRCAHPRLLLGC